MSDHPMNPPAFPIVYEPRDSENQIIEGSCFYFKGMSLRQYYAAKAIQGLCANPRVQENKPKPNDLANAAFEMADYMILIGDESVE